MPPDVHALRTRLDLTQQQCADLLGVTGRTWQNWEAGERIPWPVQQLLHLIARHPELIPELPERPRREPKTT